MKRQIERKGESSLWNSSMGFALGLCWDLKDKITWEDPWNRNPAPSFRRPGFPSWSWTGWFGTINWEYADKNTVWIDAGFQVKVELCDGQVMDWPTFQASYNTLSDSTAISQYIIISAWTTRVKFLKHAQLWRRRDANSNFCLARVELEDGGHLLWEFPTTTKEKFSPDKEYLGIHLIDYEPDSTHLHSKRIYFRGPALLIVSKVKDRMERVGFGWVTHSNYKMYNADGVWEYASSGVQFTSPWSRNRPQMVKAWQEIRLG
jgi:hypothetical protein